MLRRPVKKSHVVKQKETNKRKIDDSPLGLEKKTKTFQQKSEKEKALETLVLGGEKEIIKEFEKREQVEKSKHRKLAALRGEEKKAAWEDEDDNQGSILLSKARRFKDIRHGEEKKISKSEYSKRLKSQFEKVSSTPNWAKLPSERDRNSDEEDSDVEDILQKTGTFITSSTSLPKTVLQIKPCTDLNKESPQRGKLTALQFHPSAQVAVTGGLNNTLTLFQVDGKVNSKIQSLFLENFPVFCAHFTQDGEQIVIGSRHKSFKYFDMISGQVVNVPMKGLDERCLNEFAVSPDGRFLVFLGKYGAMHFISSKSKEWLFTLTMNGNVTSVDFTNDGQQMFSHGDEGQVYVWDIRSRECTHRFMDDGCTRGTTVAVSKNNQYIACGSNTGVVNLYERETCLSSFEPKPLKAIMNLTSSCTHAKFNSTSEMLAIASNTDEKAIKLVHVASQTVFSNFPDNLDNNLRIPSVLDFSLNSGYLTVGTHKGKALLYRLKHYGNY